MIWSKAVGQLRDISTPKSAQARRNKNDDGKYSGKNKLILFTNLLEPAILVRLKIISDV